MDSFGVLARPSDGVGPEGGPGRAHSEPVRVAEPQVSDLSVWRNGKAEPNRQPKIGKKKSVGGLMVGDVVRESTGRQKKDWDW